MPGKPINQTQVNIYMSSRKQGHKQVTAAAIAGISERSARRIDSGKHTSTRKIRSYRTRKDPLQGAFEEHLVPLLEQEPTLQPITLLEVLMERCPNQFDDRCLRTLQRRVKQWLAVSGPEKEVMFYSDMSLGDKACLTILTLSR